MEMKAYHLYNERLTGWIQNILYTAEDKGPGSEDTTTEFIRAKAQEWEFGLVPIWFTCDNAA